MISERNAAAAAAMWNDDSRLILANVSARRRSRRRRRRQSSKPEVHGASSARALMRVRAARSTLVDVHIDKYERANSTRRRMHDDDDDDDVWADVNVGVRRITGSRRPVPGRSARRENSIQRDGVDLRGGAGRVRSISIALRARQVVDNLGRARHKFPGGRDTACGSTAIV